MSSLELVSTKISDDSLSPEESEAIAKENEKMREEKALREKINNSIFATDKAQYTAGRFFDLEIPVGNNIFLPPAYVMTPSGVFYEKYGEDEEEYLRISKTPFFVASRTLTHLLLMYQHKDIWLKEWIRPSEIKASTLSNLFIFPEPGLKMKSLIEYTTISANHAPIVRDDQYIESVVKEFYRDIPPVAKYPYLVRVSELTALCNKMETKYEDVRKWMERQGFLEHGPGKVVRAEDPAFPGVKKPQRFLVLLKPFPIEIELE